MSTFSQAYVLLLLLLPAALPAQGGTVNCSKAKPGNPICYAQQMRDMVIEYLERQQKEVAARRQQYDSTSRQLDQSDRWRADSDLAQERSVRARRMANSLVAGRMDAWDWRAPLREYMAADYERMSPLLLSQLDYGTGDAFAASIEDLRADVEKARKLASLVDLLAAKRDLKSEIDRWVSFGKETRDEYEKLSCRDVNARKIKAAGELTEKTNELNKAKTAAPPNPTQIEELAAQTAELKNKVDAYTGYLKGKNCKIN